MITKKLRYFYLKTSCNRKKGLYTLLSRCIDPWNNRKVWVDNYFFQILGIPVSLGL